jgi:hypothetical protein
VVFLPLPILLRMFSFHCVSTHTCTSELIVYLCDYCFRFGTARFLQNSQSAGSVSKQLPNAISSQQEAAIFPNDGERQKKYYHFDHYAF